MNIGVIGGGQLARMLAIAGYPLGQEFVFLDPAADACAGQVGRLIVADYDDDAALDELIGSVDLVTLDFENVPVSAVQKLSPRVPVMPGEAALKVAQDRIREKSFFSDLGIPVAPFVAVESFDDLEKGLQEIGCPAVLKTRRMGYDGKGQFIIESPEDIDNAWNELRDKSLILEELVQFKRELSMIAVRSTRDEVVFYPMTENRHKKGILVTSFAPANSETVIEQATSCARGVMEALDYVGVLAIEFFDVGGRLLVNEMAPRVHNSGHWTIDGAVTSQFENHLRAIMGWPLGSTDAIGASAMMNWIGAMPDASNALSYAHAHWHDYGKKPRAGRKVGHVTICADNMLTLQTELANFAMALGQSPESSGVEAFDVHRAH